MAFFEHDFHLTIRDVDHNTEITNGAILSFFEDIGSLHSDIVGYGLKNIEKTQLSWVLLHWKVQVLKRIRYGDSIKVRTWSRGYKRACCFRDYEIYDKNGTLCAIGTSKWTLIHLKKGLMKVTDEMLDKYSSEPKCTFEHFDFNKLTEPSTYSNRYQYTVSRKDIDINHHMHNLCYLDIAYEALPMEVYENCSFHDFEIMYKSSALLGDTLICFYEKVGNEHFITIKNSDSSKLHAIVKLIEHAT